MSFRLKPCTLKEMVHFVHEVHPFFVVILSTFAHMLCGSNDDTLPSFNLFWGHMTWFQPRTGTNAPCSWPTSISSSLWFDPGLKSRPQALVQFQGHLAQNKSLNA